MKKILISTIFVLSCLTISAQLKVDSEEGVDTYVTTSITRAADGSDKQRTSVPSTMISGLNSMTSINFTSDGINDNSSTDVTAQSTIYDEFEESEKMEDSYIDKTPSYINYIKNIGREKTYEVPSPDVDFLLKEDASNIVKEKPYRYGKAIDISLSLNDGIWTEVKDGRVWTLSITSEGALSLDFLISNLVLPTGGRLDVIGDDGIAWDPIISYTCSEGSNINTQIVYGDKATFYLFEPSKSYGKSSLIISKVVYGYRSVFEQSRTGSCERNVACYPEYEELSKGVLLFYGVNPGYSGSGALVMNTNGDFKPYILTAYHNLDSNEDGVLSSTEIANCANGTFIFNHKYDGCVGNHLLLFNGDYYHGATYKSGWNGTDFALLQLSNDSIKYNSNIRWLGWDRRNVVPTSGACIHHPLTSDMKISIIDSSFASSDYESSGIYNHWKVDFSDGIIKFGSSGGPLFNQDMRIVGTIHGGHTSGDPCDWTEGWCGKFSDSWNGGGTSSTRLKDWLDPLNLGSATLDTAHPLPYYISGETVPCGVPQYRVMNLIPGDRVTWSWKSSTSVSLYQDSPSYNWCSFIAPASYFSNTLVATVTNSGDTVKVLEKNLTRVQTFQGLTTRLQRH